MNLNRDLTVQKLQDALDDGASTADIFVALVKHFEGRVHTLESQIAELAAERAADAKLWAERAFGDGGNDA